VDKSDGTTTKATTTSLRKKQHTHIQAKVFIDIPGHFWPTTNILPLPTSLPSPSNAPFPPKKWAGSEVGHASPSLG